MFNTFAGKLYQEAIKNAKTNVKEIEFDVLSKQSRNPDVNMKIKRDDNQSLSQTHLNESMKNLIENWIYPIYQDTCQKGDSIYCRAEFDDKGLFKSPQETVIRLSIPRTCEGKWMHYILENRVNLTQLHNQIQKIHFKIQNHKVNQIFLYLEHPIDEQPYHVCKDTQHNHRFLALMAAAYKDSLLTLENNKHYHSYQFEIAREGEIFSIVNSVEYKLRIGGDSV